VTAKGLEDTAFYRYYPLASLCEVGGEPARFGTELETFHQQNRQRLSRWPHTLLATSTHDTKRSEDVRARINVISEIPARWYRAARRWQNLNREKKALIDGWPAPDANEEYLLYQTLVGTWPLGAGAGSADPPFVRRIQEYMIKALREAKIHSSWLSPNEEYEQAMRDFIEQILAAGSPFVSDFSEFQAPMARAGLFNSLSQTLLKITAPGVPDFYQGSEIWDFSLVDPDNRRPVDYTSRQHLLASLRTSEEADRLALADELMRNLEDGRIKLFLTSRALNFRRHHRELFERGEYLPVPASGERERHVISFARKAGDQAAIVVAARFFMRLESGSRLPIGDEVWGNTALKIEEALGGCYRDVFTGRSICARLQPQGSELLLAEVCAHLPVALLERV
jgi:(1->4)-alpha-D-glucan 1-alpha-D-glucosylmutase